MNTITSPDWWKAAAFRGLRTALTIAVPYLGAASLFHAIPWLSVVSAAGLGFIASLVTSLAGIPEATGKGVSVYLALLERTVKTVAQGIAVGIGNTILFQDVSWSHVWQAALLAGLGSLLIGVLGFLPESAATNPLAVQPVALKQIVMNTHAETIAAAPADPDAPAIDPPGTPVSNGI